MSDRYRHSEELLARAEKTIPLGTQTFSKSKTQFPHGVSPFYAARAQGSKLWDADGNEYIDFINSLASVTLGYNDPDVTAAVRRQLEDGVIFSLPHQIEIEVAELIVELVPCADAVRFGKNGSDATAGCIRIARAFTNRDHVAVCGYHGWQDWYIGSTARNRGVPMATRALTHRFDYNNLDFLQKAVDRTAGRICRCHPRADVVGGASRGISRGRRRTDAQAWRSAGVRRSHHRLPLRQWRGAGVFRRDPGPDRAGQGHRQRLSAVGGGGPRRRDEAHGGDLLLLHHGRRDAVAGGSEGGADKAAARTGGCDVAAARRAHPGRSR